VDPNAPLLADYHRLFGHDNGTPWTSRYFRETFLYPSLYAQRAADDPFLLAFDGTPGNRTDENSGRFIVIVVGPALMSHAPKVNFARLPKLKSTNTLAGGVVAPPKTLTLCIENGLSVIE
jgi:hypothetical protein